MTQEKQEKPVLDKKGKKRRLVLAFLPPLLIVAIVALLAKMEFNKPYKEFEIGGETLYAPRTFLAEEQADFMNMMREYVSRVELDRYQFNAAADDLLPANLIDDHYIAASSIIWTIGEKQSEDAKDQAQRDQDFYSATGRYIGRTTSPQQYTGLTKLQLEADGPRHYGFTNSDPTKTPYGDAVWVAHCVELSGVRQGAPWGRCTSQFSTGRLHVQFHYDGRLLQHTAAIQQILSDQIDLWSRKPDSGVN